MEGNTGNGLQDVSKSQYITTITQTSSSFVETFTLSSEQMECSDGADSGQSVAFKQGLDPYVSFADCERACQVEDECNGMIEYGLHVCTEQAVDPTTGLTKCTEDWHTRDGRCIAEDRCTCYLVTGTCSQPVSHLHYNIWRMERTPSSATPFVATVRAAQGRLSGISVFLCKSILYGAFVWARRALNGPKRRFRPGQCEHKDRCGWTPAGGVVSTDRSKPPRDPGPQKHFLGQICIFF